ncbi:MAG: helix-turn-helix transcriptional regulator [Mesorhizobium sp.]|uniref:helix-turn-helix domain-containing protein n=1 Tax=Mesorhizobium sp. TaxID=1871066 RepID=UPI00121D06EA|nr:helix-turn-helix transcriptional regulator [Mesorhizobium sp.]TIN01003.1 MAG: helix-turn-helix transcriptional regulator [Mesorhizobium sp.]
MSDRHPQARTASPATRSFFEVIGSSGVSQAKVADECGIHVNTFYAWKTGKASATVFNMEAALSVLGLELVIRPIRQPEPMKE